MSPSAALFACAFLVVALLRIERGRNPTASLALWIPTIWMLISGSRAVGRWFAVDVGDIDAQSGSLPDRLVLMTLTILAASIAARRKVQWSRILRDNLWLIV